MATTKAPPILATATTKSIWVKVWLFPTYDFENHSQIHRASGCPPETWTLDCERRRGSLRGILKTQFPPPHIPHFGGVLLGFVFCTPLFTCHPPATPQANPRLEVVTSGGFPSTLPNEFAMRHNSLLWWLAGRGVRCRRRGASPTRNIFERHRCERRGAGPTTDFVERHLFVRTCKFRFLIQTTWLQVSGVPTVTMRQHIWPIVLVLVFAWLFVVRLKCLSMMW